MKDFTASNGITIYVRDGGTVQFQHGTREESCGVLQIFPHSEWWQTLREFFRAEADELCGIWRSRVDPSWTAVREGDVVHFQNSDHQRGFHIALVNDAWMHQWSKDLLAVAREYVDAHPDPKPWHDAEIGEVWVMGPLDAAYTVVGGVDSGRWFVRADVFGQVESLNLTDSRFTRGTRVWRPRTGEAGAA